MLPAKCVMIVDDEPNVRLMLRTALESANYRVQEAAEGESALAQLRDCACDLVLLDLRLPRIDGMETLRRLRGEGNATPVVMLTAHGSIPDAVTAMKLGAIDFLTKPITPQALRAVVAEVIRRQEESTAPQPAPTARPTPQRRTIAFELARAKRALNRGEFADAERLLRDAMALDPHSDEAHELLDRLLTLKERDGRGSFSILRDWFPGGAARSRP